MTGYGPQILTPLQLLDRLAALVPPPRIYRHRCFGILAPHSPLRTAVTARAPGATTAPPRIAPARGPPLWEAADPEHDPAADPLLPPIPAFEFDQRLSW